MKYRLILLLLLVAALSLLGWWAYHRIPHIAILEEEALVSPTPTILRDIRSTQRLVTLIVEDEEAVKRSHFTGDVLKLYSATYELGVDLTPQGTDWFSTDDSLSTVTIHLPAITILNPGNGIDAARTIDIYGSSTDGNELASMRREADRIMRKRALTPGNVERARRNAEATLRSMFTGLGYNQITIYWASSDTPDILQGIPHPFAPQR